MMTEIWINLPVKDIKRSKEFFTRVGFTFNEQFADSDAMACMLIGNKNMVVMLFVDEVFKNFTRNDIPNTTTSTEVLFSIDVESRDEVDVISRKVVEAGGTLFGQPGEIQGWMYGCGFVDLDGHRWNLLFRDLSKMT